MNLEGRCHHCVSGGSLVAWMRLFEGELEERDKPGSESKILVEISYFKSAWRREMRRVKRSQPVMGKALELKGGQNSQKKEMVNDVSRYREIKY